MKFFGERSSLTAAARVEWEAWNVNDAFGVSFLISRRRRLSHVADFSASQREARQSLPLLDFVFMRSNKISILYRTQVPLPPFACRCIGRDEELG